MAHLPAPARGLSLVAQTGNYCAADSPVEEPVRPLVLVLVFLALTSLLPAPSMAEASTSDQPDQEAAFQPDRPPDFPLSQVKHLEAFAARAFEGECVEGFCFTSKTFGLMVADSDGVFLEATCTLDGCWETFRRDPRTSL